MMLRFQFFFFCLLIFFCVLLLVIMSSLFHCLIIDRASSSKSLLVDYNAKIILEIVSDISVISAAAFLGPPMIPA